MLKVKVLSDEESRRTPPLTNITAEFNTLRLKGCHKPVAEKIIKNIEAYDKELYDYRDCRQCNPYNGRFEDPEARKEVQETLGYIDTEGNYTLIKRISEKAMAALLVQFSNHAIDIRHLEYCWEVRDAIIKNCDRNEVIITDSLMQGITVEDSDAKDQQIDCSIYGIRFNRLGDINKFLDWYGYYDGDITEEGGSPHLKEYMYQEDDEAEIAEAWEKEKDTLDS